MALARATWYIYVRNFKVWLRQPFVVIPGLLISVFLFLVFGSTFTELVQVPGFPSDDYTTFITAMILIQAMVFSSGDAGFALITDIVSGYLEKLLLAPINRFAILLGTLLMAATRLVAAVLLIIAVAFAMGVSFKGGVGAVFLVIFLATLFGVAWSCIALMIVLRTRSAQAAQASFVLFFPAIFLTTSFMPYDLLPRWFQIAVNINPVNYVLEAIRVVIIEGWVWDTILIGLGVLLGLTAVLMALTTELYRRVTA